MGNVQAIRGRMTPAIIVVALAVVAVIVALGVMARPAQAQPTFTQCATCHSQSSIHGNANHAGFFGTCTTCHNNGGTANPPLPTACGACHGGPAAILAKPTHTSLSCGTTVGCHGFVSPSPTSSATPTPTPTPTATLATTTLTAKVSPALVKVGKKVKVSGQAGPVPALAGAKIAFKVERKVGTKWVKMKATASAKAGADGAYTWTYKAAKKGSHRVTLTIAKSATYTMKKMIKTFKVK